MDGGRLTAPAKKEPMINISNIKTPVGTIKDLMEKGSWFFYKENDRFVLKCKDGERSGYVIYVDDNVSNNGDWGNPVVKSTISGDYKLLSRLDNSLKIYIPVLIGDKDSGPKFTHGRLF